MPAGRVLAITLLRLRLDQQPFRLCDIFVSPHLVEARRGAGSYWDGKVRMSKLFQVGEQSEWLQVFG